MFYFCLGLSAVLLAVVNAIAILPKKPRPGLASLISAVAVVPFLFCMGLLLLPLNALCVALAGGVCYSVGAHPRWFLVSSLGATATAYALMIWGAVDEIRKWDQLKAVYPMESVAPRLAREKHTRHDTGSTFRSDAVSAFEGRIERTDAFPNRVRSLERLHAGVVTQFVGSRGFGVMRALGQPDPFYLEEDDKPEQPIDWSPTPTAELSSPPASPDVLRQDVSVAESPFNTAHDENALDFLNPLSFGYVRDRDHVAGFRSHQFHNRPKAPQRWRVTELELVSLLKYDDPVVYLSENLPKMDELRDAPTRPLDPFEAEALAALLRGEDLMVRESPERMRMLGSLRAAKQCLRCHSVERGDLLGAFSYRLVRETTKE